MSIVVPDVGEESNLAKFLNQILTMKLFSNNIVPAEGDTAASYTPVVGGGYADKSLTYANWTIVAGAPAVATYLVRDFVFTGPTTAPGTIYGYYIVDAAGTLLWAERFEEAVLPFTPIAGSLIRITPRFEAS